MINETHLSQREGPAQLCWVLPGQRAADPPFGAGVGKLV